MKPINIVKIAQAALEFAAAAQARKQAEETLDNAYRAWKRQNEISVHIERGSEIWDAMLAATQHEYRALRNAKARERRRRDGLVKMAGRVQA